MGKNSVMNKGDAFVMAHNARILKRAKQEAHAMRQATQAWMRLVNTLGLFADETSAAEAAKRATERAFWTKARKAGYITPNDKLLFAVTRGGRQ